MDLSIGWLALVSATVDDEILSFKFQVPREFYGGLSITAGK